MLLKDLEGKRARLQELEAATAGQAGEVEALTKQVEAQDALIRSLSRASAGTPSEVKPWTLNWKRSAM